MKSSTARPLVGFALLQDRLLTFVLARVNNGDFTERGLARIMGISQPQIHNVLKGKRKLQTVLADRMMQKFQIDLLDLLHDSELRERLVLRPELTPFAQPVELALQIRKGPGKDIPKKPARDDKAS